MNKTETMRYNLLIDAVENYFLKSRNKIFHSFTESQLNEIEAELKHIINEVFLLNSAAQNPFIKKIYPTTMALPDILRHQTEPAESKLKHILTQDAAKRNLMMLKLEATIKELSAIDANDNHLLFRVISELIKMKKEEINHLFYNSDIQYDITDNDALQDLDQLLKLLKERGSNE